MSISLQKGQKVNLSKSSEGLKRVMVGLGWDEAQPQRLFGLFGRKPQDIDCDASAILCGSNGKTVSSDIKKTCVYFGNLKHSSGAIVHQGDNLTGGGDGDDEEIMVTLSLVPEDVYKIVFVVNIYDARARNQHFGMIKNAFIRLVDLDKKSEICRYNLSDNYDNMTGLIVGELCKTSGGWEFNAVGQPVREASRLGALVQMYQ